MGAYYIVSKRANAHLREVEMPYFVYDKNTGEIVDGGALRTLAEANAKAAESADYLVSPERNDAEAFAAEPGHFYLVADGSFKPGPPDTDRERLQDAARALQLWLIDLASELAVQGYTWPRIAVEKAHDFVYEALRAAWIIMRNAVYTVAQRITWAEQMSMGSTDFSTANEFYLKVVLLPAPTEPNTWVHPATGTQVSLEASLMLSGPGTMENPGLNLMGNVVPATTLLGESEWIDNLLA